MGPEKSPLFEPVGDLENPIETPCYTEVLKTLYMGNQ
jgi:hypothetical protein